MNCTATKFNHLRRFSAALRCLLDDRLKWLDSQSYGNPGAAAAATLLAIAMSSPIVSATSQPMLQLEEYVKDASPGRALVSQVLVYDYDQFADFGSPGDIPQVTVSFGLEDGAFVLAESPGKALERGQHYLPMDVDIGYSRLGVFMGSAQIDVQIGSTHIGRRQYFWLRHTGNDTLLISHREYKAERLSEERSKLIPPNPNLNLEPGDIPGEATTVEDEFDVLACAGGRPCTR